MSFRFTLEVVGLDPVGTDCLPTEVERHAGGENDEQGDDRGGFVDKHHEHTSCASTAGSHPHLAARFSPGTVGLSTSRH